MEIEYLGHSSFKLTESTGRSVVTDPFSGDKQGYDFPKTVSDTVTISHNHFDHNRSDCVKGVKTVITKPGEYDLDGITAFGFLTYHDNHKGERIRERNVVYKFRIDGINICHLGDIGERIGSQVAELIGNVNILMIPVGGTFTLDAERAKEYVDRIMPDIVIPMHYYDDENIGNASDLAEVQDFTELFDEDFVEYSDDSKVKFDRSDFDGETTKILVLTRKNKA
ncbi:MAG: MBL fold metallo-hydrolase [Christensenellaceae bacterium]|jgi:L-ascorbate metabolism protein UlaG (beta-lactamase superfamily)|nr:MBL fold metallo-hydrolase [Christensenellaceae bacterium]